MGKQTEHAALIYTGTTVYTASWSLSGDESGGAVQEYGSE
jgi:hypothetical protein